MARCDDNTLFNVVGHCFDILLRRVTPKYDLRRQRRKEKRDRRQARQEGTNTAGLTAAFENAAEQPAAAAEPASATG